MQTMRNSELINFLRCDGDNAECERIAEKAMQCGSLSVVTGRNVSAFLWQIWLRHTAFNKRLAAEDAAEREQARRGAAVVDYTPYRPNPSQSGLYLLVDPAAEQSLKAVQTLHDSPFYKLSMFAPITPASAYETLNRYSMQSINKNSPQEVYGVFLVLTPAANKDCYAQAASEVLNNGWLGRQAFIIVYY